MKTFSIISAFIFTKHLVSANPAPAAASASAFVASSGSIVPSLSIPPPAASAIAEPEITVSANFVSTEESSDCMKFTEESIRFPGLGDKVKGRSWVKLCKDGHYDMYGLLRNDGSGKAYNVAWWWEIQDSKGRYYYFGSEKKCGPYHKLKNRGDICEWSQDWAYNDSIKKHWKDLKAWHSAKGYPVKY